MLRKNKNKNTQCKAITKKSEQCSKDAKQPSRYCIHHQENKSFKQTLKGIAIGLISGFVVSFSSMIGWDLYNNSKENSIIESIRPEISVKIKELGESKLNVSIEMINNNGNYVDDFFFDFVIPGEFISTTRDLLQNVGNAVVTHRPLTTHGSRVTSETIFIRVSRLYSTGLYGFLINYISTKISEEPDPNNLPGVPYLDIQDYQPVSYYWTYKGITRKEMYFLDLTDLDFIKKGNDNLINFKQKFSNSENYTHENHERWEIDIAHITDETLIKKY